VSGFLANLLFIAAAAAAVAIPPLRSHVTDLTNTLNENQRTALEHTLAEFKARKGSQIAVLLVPTTQPETPVEYGVRVYDAWKLGRKGIDDGVLLLVAREDRKVWIVTGRGVEGPLPDAAVKRIVEDDITPRFKQGDFYGGIRAGTDRIMRTIEGEPLPPPRTGGQLGGRALQHLDWLIPAVIVLFIGGGILRALFGRFVGSGLVGALGAGALWLVFGSILISVIAGLFLFVTGLFGSASLRPRSGGWGGGGWGGGWSSGGGSWGGGSSGGGGFSGGGGGTSGGGAGGSW
jgi:uncharacterized protein